MSPITRSINIKEDKFNLPKEKPPRDRSLRTTRWSSPCFNQTRCDRWVSLYKLDLDPLTLSHLLDGAVSQYLLFINRPEKPSATETKESFEKIGKLSNKLKGELEALDPNEISLINVASKGDINGLNEILKKNGRESVPKNRTPLVSYVMEICTALEHLASIASTKVRRSKVGPKSQDAFNALVISLVKIYQEHSQSSDRSPIDFIYEITKKLEVQRDKQQIKRVLKRHEI